MKDTEIKDKTLKWICEHDAIIDNHPEVFPCTWIAKDIHESVYKVRKCMKELESDGYVKKSSEGGFDDWYCEIYCIHKVNPFVAIGGNPLPLGGGRSLVNRNIDFH